MYRSVISRMRLNQGHLFMICQATFLHMVRLNKATIGRKRPKHIPEGAHDRAHWDGLF